MGWRRDKWGWMGWEKGPYLQPEADARIFPSGIAGAAGGPLPGGLCAVATGSDSQSGRPSCTCRPDPVASCLANSYPVDRCLKLLDSTLAQSTVFAPQRASQQKIQVHMGTQAIVHAGLVSIGTPHRVRISSDAITVLS